MKPVTEKEALETLEMYASDSRRPGETQPEALARACREQPGLYSTYDSARRRAAKEGRAPHPAKAAEPPKFQRDDEKLIERLTRRANAAWLDLADWLKTREGQAAYADYDKHFKGR